MGNKQLRLLEACLASLNDVILITDARPGAALDHCIVYVNDAFVRSTGYSRDEVLGRNPRFLQGPKTQRDALDRISASLARGRPAREELINYTKDGKEFWLELDIVPVADAHGRHTHFVSIQRDISQRKTAETELAGLGARLTGVIYAATDAIISTDDSQRITMFNAAAEAMFGYRAQDMLGEPIERLIPERFRSAYQHHVDAFAQTGAATCGMGGMGQISGVRANGYEFPIEASISQVITQQRKIFTVMLRDVTASRQAQQALESAVQEMLAANERLKHSAYFDELTGLPNRVMLADRLEQAMAHCHRRSQSMTVAYLDLDGFKAVNDTYGHHTGDALLISLATRMKGVLRAGDTLGRIGGNEFVVILADQDHALDCESALTRLMVTIREPVELDNALIKISASIGVTTYPQDGADADQLLRHANQAMYLAKQAGKDRYHLFDTVHDTAVKSQLEILRQVRLALLHDEFVLYYQPKVNMRTGRVIGAEALIRWQHPSRGLLPPAAFLPLIEEHPISIAIGEWVIATALAQMTRWNRIGLTLDISVNIGARQLQQPSFATALAEVLAQYPQRGSAALELEILETVALKDIGAVSDVIFACRALGVRFALDDFGTGYSSLTYLRRLSVETLKIDQSFIRDMLDDPDDLAIVQGIVGLAAAFRRDVIAEGVESVRHGVVLLSLGCELAQGYGIARPMPAAAFPDWAANWQPDESWHKD